LEPVICSDVIFSILSTVSFHEVVRWAFELGQNFLLKHPCTVAEYINKEHLQGFRVPSNKITL